MNLPEARPSDGGDFPDWFNPIIVKEMRQILRTPMFIWTFVVFVVLVVMATASIVLLNAESRFPGRATVARFSALLWSSAALTFLVIVPAQGLNSLGREVGAQTVDLLLLSRLKAWDVVIGKWGALQSQALLLACLLLPFVMLRFLLAGESLLRDLHALAMFLVLSMILTAITVGTSALPIVTRLAVLGALAFAVFVLLPELSDALSFQRRVRRGVSGWKQGGILRIGAARHSLLS